MCKPSVIREQGSIPCAAVTFWKNFFQGESQKSYFLSLVRTTTSAFLFNGDGEVIVGMWVVAVAEIGIALFPAMLVAV
jgi:hypothetical protein